MAKPPQEVPDDQRAKYAQLQASLRRIGFISQGSVMERPPDRGPRYQWTRKEKAKTVTVALSKEQFEWLKKATANQRELKRIIRHMQKLSHQILFESVPGTTRRKRLSKKVLDAI
jgi:hypothetical protein